MPPRWWTAPAVTRIRLSLVLLTERRLVLYLVADLFFLGAGLLLGLMGEIGSATSFYFPLFLMPALILGVPILADAVDVERRSGTLDLALSSPGASWYFERRIAAVGCLLVIQGWFAIAMTRLFAAPFPPYVPLAQVVTVSAFLCAAVLNWAVRLRSPGAVIFATYATCVAFFPWFFSNPIHPPTEAAGPMTGVELFAWFREELVLVGATLIFYLYAQQRLSRPETIIT